VPALERRRPGRLVHGAPEGRRGAGGGGEIPAERDDADLVVQPPIVPRPGIGSWLCRILRRPGRVCRVGSGCRPRRRGGQADTLRCEPAQLEPENSSSRIRPWEPPDLWTSLMTQVRALVWHAAQRPQFQDRLQDFSTDRSPLVELSNGADRPWWCALARIRICAHGSGGDPVDCAAGWVWLLRADLR
jgi:hypothetical protein